LSWTELVVSTVILTSAVAGLGAILTNYGASQRAQRAKSSYPPLGDFVEVAGGQVHYVQKGTGPDVILLHGAGGNLREFTFDLMGRLTDRYRVTAFDRPGLGYTDRVPGVETGPLAIAGDPPQDQAKMLREAATTLGIAQPIMVGHSFGGIVAYAWAIAGLTEESPVNASAVVSLAGVTMPWPGDLGRYYTVNGSALGGVVTIPLISAFAPQSTIADIIDATFAPQSTPEGYTAYIGAELTLRVESMRANIRQVNTLRPEVVKLTDQYPALTLPIEIVHGEADTTVPIFVHADEIEKIVPQVNVVRLPGVGHMPHHAAPEVTVAAIDRAARRAGLR